MSTIVVITRPVCPVHAPSRTRPANTLIRWNTSWTPGTTSVPVDLNPLADVGTQRRVAHSPVLGRVEVLTGVHRLDTGHQPGPLGQAQQQIQGVLGDPMLREVDHKIAGVQGEPRGPVWVGTEQHARVLILHRRRVRGECPPLRRRRDRGSGHRLVTA